MFNSRPLDFDPMATLAVQSDLALRAIEAEQRAAQAEDRLLAVETERDRLADEVATLKGTDSSGKDTD